ncbi:MAG TPA: hydrogenase maturation protease [Chitinophagaceae bacterium]|nr:hydrogenase maturation protease [Chitinophagaceae bacterium]
MHQLKTLCILGTGNTLRSDDGIGAYVCQQLEILNLEGVTIHNIHQLQTEWLDELADFNTVLIVDAAINNNDVINIVPIDRAVSISSNISHHINVNLLADLMTTMNNSRVHFYTCAIPGENFDFGENLSSRGRKNAERAVGLITHWLFENGFNPAPGA